MDGIAAIIPCPKENVFIFNVQDDTDVEAKILNVSFSVRRPDSRDPDNYYPPHYLQERVYLNRAILARLANVLPFDDNLCVREPCVNFEQCLSVLKFGNASGFISSDTLLFRPIYPVNTFACRCPHGFTEAPSAEVNYRQRPSCGLASRKSETPLPGIINFPGVECRLTLSRSIIDIRESGFSYLQD
ncbi:protocadherin-like wing polarity protein stan [Caerostris extrusa]|uniref:Protocadherin-like wing polarity protein stan n=1 Tax=Caerostris extrusa TaxID=172846 RepID=A0AAV4SYM5_CAEEX|nr:protocadherin-like wing polarity protein stan [Caerostris extrusa]